LKACCVRPYNWKHARARSCRGRSTRVLKNIAAVTLAHIVLLVAAGVRSHSLALLSEAGHNLSDFLALLLSLVRGLFPVAVPPVPPRPTATIVPECWRRLVNAASLVAVHFSSSTRPSAACSNPEQVAGQRDDVGGSGRRGCERSHRAASLSLEPGIGRRRQHPQRRCCTKFGDTLSTAAVIFGGWAILVTGNYWIDSALSFGIGVLILWSGFGIVARDASTFCSKARPRGMKLEKDRVRHRSIEGVNEVHDLHCLEHRIRNPCAFLPHCDRRHSAFDQRTHLARRERAAAATTSASTTLRSSSSTWCAKWRMACVIPVAESEEHIIVTATRKAISRRLLMRRCGAAADARRYQSRSLPSSWDCCQATCGEVPRSERREVSSHNGRFCFGPRRRLVTLRLIDQRAKARKHIDSLSLRVSRCALQKDTFGSTT